MAEEKEYYYGKNGFNMSEKKNDEIKKMTKVTNKDEMYRVYGIVMEQMQTFEQELQSVFRLFHLASKQISKRSDEDHIKKIYAGNYFTEAEVNQLFACLTNEYIIKEIFFYSQYPTDMKECSRCFYDCYVTFLAGYELLQMKVQEWISKSKKKA